MNDIIILSSLHIFIIMNITFNHSTIIISIETAIISKARLPKTQCSCVVCWLLQETTLHVEKLREETKLCFKGELFIFPLHYGYGWQYDFLLDKPLNHIFASSFLSKLHYITFIRQSLVQSTRGINTISIATSYTI